MKILPVFFSFLFLIVSSSSFADKPMTVEECGIYPVEGYYAEINSPEHERVIKPVLLLNRGSDSEVRVYLLNTNLDKLIPRSHLGAKFKINLEFVSQCLYRCEGRIVKVIAPLDPFEEAKHFTTANSSMRIGPKTPCKTSTIPLQSSAL